MAMLHSCVHIGAMVAVHTRRSSSAAASLARKAACSDATSAACFCESSSIVPSCSPLTPGVVIAAVCAGLKERACGVAYIGNLML